MSSSDSCGGARGGTATVSCCGGAVLATLCCDVEAAGSAAECLCSSRGEPLEEAQTVLVCVVCAPGLLSSGSVPSTRVTL